MQGILTVVPEQTRWLTSSPGYTGRKDTIRMSKYYCPQCGQDTPDDLSFTGRLTIPAAIRRGAVHRKAWKSVPAVKGSDTSEAAATSMIPHAGTVQAKVLGILERFGPRTDDYIEQLLGMRHQTVSAARRSLVLKGLVFDSGDRSVTRSGRKAVEWQMREQG